VLLRLRAHGSWSSRRLAGAAPSAPARWTDAPGTYNVHSPTPHAGQTHLLGRRPSRKQMCPRGALFHVFHLGGPPTTCSCLHSSTAEASVQEWTGGCSQLPWPARWALKARTRSLLAPVVCLHPQRVHRSLCFCVVLSTVARHRPRSAVLRDRMAAMLTPKGYEALWSFSTH